MTQGTEEWYVAMASAIKAREHAEVGIKRWQEKLAEAETKIQELANGNAPTLIETASEQAPVQE